MIVGAILAAVYAFRVVFYMFFAPERSGAVQMDDVPPAMLAPVVLLGVGTWVLGIAAIWILPYIQRFVALLVS
jgi:NADH:ubiquinone oxidoreductase subunit 5 (subunit L)/multisubunit Na+/H+ antiporter MnhA subunit